MIKFKKNTKAARNRFIAMLTAAVVTVVALPRMQPKVEAGQYLGEFRLTAYCPCRSCSGKWGHKTASGATAEEGITVASGRNIPLGSVIYIDGVGYRTVQDRGGAVKGNHIDIFVENHGDCYQQAFNRRNVKVWIKND